MYESSLMLSSLLTFAGVAGGVCFLIDDPGRETLPMAMFRLLFNTALVLSEEEWSREATMGYFWHTLETIHK